MTCPPLYSGGAVQAIVCSFTFPGLSKSIDSRPGAVPLSFIVAIGYHDGEAKSTPFFNFLGYFFLHHYNTRKKGEKDTRESGSWDHGIRGDQ